MNFISSQPCCFEPSLPNSGWLPALVLLYCTVGMTALGLVFVVAAANAFIAGIKMLNASFDNAFGPDWSWWASRRSRRAPRHGSIRHKNSSEILESIFRTDALPFVAAIKWKADGRDYSWMLLRSDADGSLECRARARNADGDGTRRITSRN